jgi:SOS-response transcriptional repressor LexA
VSQQKKSEILRNFPDAIKGIRLRRGLSQVDFADLLGISAGAVANWESRQNAPSNQNLGKIAEKLGVTVEFLLGETRDGEAKPSALKEHGGPYWGTSNMAPIVSWASAGSARAFLDQGSDVEHIATNCKDPNCYALIVEGDSMEPNYRRGDVLIVTPRIEPVNGDLVVAKNHNEEVFFKIFHRSGSEGATVRFTSYNPAYPVLEYKSTDFYFIHPIHSITRRLRKD